MAPIQLPCGQLLRSSHRLLTSGSKHWRALGCQMRAHAQLGLLCEVSIGGIEGMDWAPDRSLCQAWCPASPDSNQESWTGQRLDLRGYLGTRSDDGCSFQGEGPSPPYRLHSQP